ncbi:L,D-transpeptidase family protein [Schaedlerella sp.]|uniref:L,D-transpeptidase family protein n=1 Tax=Schaedlerella sp. TaxID=2676057 RepID=UPI0037455042
MNPTDTPLTDHPQNTPQETPVPNSQGKPQERPQNHLESRSQADSDASQEIQQNLSDESSLHSSADSAPNPSTEPLQSSSTDSVPNPSTEPLQSSSTDSAPNPSTEPLQSSSADSPLNPSTEPPKSNSAQDSQQPPAQVSSQEAAPSAAEPAKTLPYKKTAAWTAAVLAAVLLLTYLGVSIYFRSHYLFNTTINGQDFSKQTVEDARAFFAGQADAYALKITESGGKTEDITGSEIDMSWNDSQALDQILKDQNAFAWPMEYFKETSKEITFDISYDKAALEKKVSSLKAVTAEPIQPQSAYPEFDGNSYVIKPEVYGTDLDSKKLLKQIHESVARLDEEIDLQKEGFYKAPEYTAESPKLKELCQTLNQYCKASITYEMDIPIVVDKTLISTWLSYDADFHVTLDEAAIRNWMTEFGRRYDTVGTTRPLTTPTGKATEVSGGTYGWIINEEEEFPALVSSIRDGEVVPTAPACDQTAASHAPQDWGGTFVEVDLTAQHMWYLENGTVVFESDVVTGKNSTPTPPGVYNILEKLSPTVLVGNIVPETNEPEYRTPVDFWMRVTWSGIGFHDATWQPAFGGDVYLWNGSHGCINMPYYNAQELYSILQLGTPVVVHY